MRSELSFYRQTCQKLGLSPLASSPSQDSPEPSHKETKSQGYVPDLCGFESHLLSTPEGSTDFQATYLKEPKKALPQASASKEASAQDRLVSYPQLLIGKTE